MDRVACVNIPSLALQLLLKRHPEWHVYPVVVVDQDKPQGFVLQANHHARRQHISPGMRYAAGLSLAVDLRAGTLESHDIDPVCENFRTMLYEHTPYVECAESEPGLFWLMATGMERFFGSFSAWGRGVAAAFAKCGYKSSVVVGYSRFGTYAIAKAQRVGVLILTSPTEEESLVRNVPISRVDLTLKQREYLEALGIDRLGAFLDLPANGVRKRFGLELLRLHRRARGEQSLPFQRDTLKEPLRKRIETESEVTDTTQIFFYIKQTFHPLMLDLASRHLDLEALSILLEVIKGVPIPCRIAPATATLDESRILELLRVRLESLRLSSPVKAIVIELVGTRSVIIQQNLFAESRRPLRNANQALDMVRAEFGENTVQRIVPRDEHLPEEQFVLEPLSRLELATIEDGTKTHTLIRRIHTQPRPLRRLKAESFLLQGARCDTLEPVIGPHHFRGRWWDRPFDRMYYYARTHKGDLYWIYYDRHRRRWFLHGSVE
jgi:protein ImuB